jgi:hypothetical protein
MSSKQTATKPRDVFIDDGRINERFPFAEIKAVLEKHGFKMEYACGEFFPGRREDDLIINIARKRKERNGVGAVAQFC